MARTTIILDDNVLLDVKQLARVRRTTATQIIHEALTAYVKLQPDSPLPSFVGSARSGKRTIANSAETILRRGLGGRRRS
jgi:hypothetical protein